MKGIIMAGGEGSRLRPLTCTVPKPMTEICGIPVMEHIVKLLRDNEITEIAATLQYLPSAVSDYFGDGEKFGVKLRYFEEKKPMGTAGGVKNCGDFIDDTFIIISGDSACSFNLQEALEIHNQSGADATLLLTKSDEPTEYGVVVTDEDGKITRFVEKPSWSRVYSDSINTGIYILNSSVMDLIPENSACDFGKDIFPMMLSKGMKLYGYVAKGYWCDIGSPEAYLTCNMDALDGRYNCEKQNNKPYRDDGAVIMEPCLIGENVILGEGAVVGPYAVIGDGCEICSGASVKRSYIYRNCHIGSLTEIRGAVLGKGCAVKDNVRIFEGTVIGDGCVIEDRAFVGKDVRIWPEKTVGYKDSVKENIIWGSSHRELFDDDGIGGDALVDMTPEVMTRLGGCIGKSLENKIIVTAVGDSPSSKMLLHAFVSGAMSAGCKVYDAGDVPECVWKFAVLEYGAGCGAYISDKAGRVKLNLCNGSAMPLTHSQERKIESAFLQGTAGPREKISDVSYLTGIMGIYQADLIKRARRPLGGLLCTVNCPDAVLKDCAEGALKALGSILKPGGISFYLSPDGGMLSAVDELGIYHSHESVSVLGMLSTGQDTINVPYDYPVVIDEVAKTSGIKINRVCCEEKEGAADRAVYDGCIGMINILTVMSENNTAFHELIGSLPAFAMSATFTDIAVSKSEIVRKLTENGGEQELLDGIRITVDKGNVLITPMKKSKRLRIRAESVSAEIAEELCSDYIEKIKGMEKGG